jgi:carboxyl-terminal processing protease
MSRKWLFPFAFGILLVGTVAVGFRFLHGDDSPRGVSGTGKIEEVISLLRANYIEPVDEPKLIDDAIRGMLEGLDPHTFYIPATEMQGVKDEMQGSFDGIGVEFNIVDDTILVVSPIAGGPSEKLGIMPGDKIIKINNEKVAGIGIQNGDVVKKLRGKKGTAVKVYMKRQGIKDLLEFEIVRDKIPLHSVDYSYMVDKNTGYIKVNRFAETTVRELMEHLQTLQQKGLKNLILDLRSNPGGYLDQAQMMSDIFLSGGKTLVYTEGRISSSNKRWESTDRIAGFEKGGLIILINQGSASASEIVSGAVQDWDRGLVVGTRSFGKGLVQQQYPLSDGSAVRVVVSRYFTPSGRCIQKPFKKGKEGHLEYEQEISDRFEKGEAFDPKKINFPDSLKYKTKAGRIVYGGGAIMPDVYVAPDTTGASKYLTDLIVKNLFRKFSFQFPNRHPEIKNQFKTGLEYSVGYKVTDALLKEFTTYAAENGVAYVEKDFKTSKVQIARNLKVLIGRYLYNDEGFYPVLNEDDPVFLRALALMPKAVELELTGSFAE